MHHHEAAHTKKVRPAVVMVHSKASDIGVVAYGTTSHALNRTLEFYSIEGGGRSPFEQDTLFFLGDVCRVEELTARVVAKGRRLPIQQFLELERFVQPRVFELAEAVDDGSKAGGQDGG